jgi:hypothetical protein
MSVSETTNGENEMNTQFAGCLNDVVTYSGMTQEQWDKLPADSLKDLDLSDLPPVEPFKPQPKE